MSKHTDQVIDLMNEDEETFVILRPGEEWTPGVKTEVKSDDGKCLYHHWVKVTLFTFTVEECSKCGVLRDE